MMKYLKGFGACIVFSLTFLFTSTNAIAQTCGSDCITCIEGGPCCTVYNACNAYQTYCFDCDAYYGTTENNVYVNKAAKPITPKLTIPALPH